MYIQELYQLTLWAEKEIIEKQLIQKYQQLIQKLTENSQPSRPKQPFEVQKDNLIETLKSIKLAVLNEEQKNFLAKLNILDTLGENAIEKIENILFKNSLDIATAIKYITDMRTRLNQGMEKLTSIRTGLEGNVDVEDIIVDKVVMRIHFDHEASINNVTDFKKWSTIWYDISRGITMLHGETPEDIQVVGANKGSIIIELASTYAITKTISEIILKVLQVVEKVYDIRLKAEEVRAMKLNNKKIAMELEKEATDIKKKEIEKVLEELLSKHTHTDGEVNTTLTKSITKLLDFIDKGGEVDFTIPNNEDEEEDEEVTKMKESLEIKFQEIRQIENKLKLIQHKS
jgi:hypothetical protein